MESVNDKLIKKSAEDTSGFTPRVSANTLRSGEEYDRCIVACKATALVPPGYSAARVIDYCSFATYWDSNLVKFYYEHDEDPRTRVVSFRVTPEGDVTPT